MKGSPPHSGIWNASTARKPPCAAGSVRAWWCAMSDKTAKALSLSAADRQARVHGFTIRRNASLNLFEMKRFGGAFCWHRALTYYDVQAAVDDALRRSRASGTQNV
jgi:hypothetical protein